MKACRPISDAQKGRMGMWEVKGKMEKFRNENGMK
jgi:hypothetical protein